MAPDTLGPQHENERPEDEHEEVEDDIAGGEDRPEVSSRLAAAVPTTQDAASAVARRHVRTTSTAPAPPR